MIRVTCSITERGGNTVVSSATGSIRESVEFTLRSFNKVLFDQKEMDELVHTLEREGHATYELKIERV